MNAILAGQKARTIIVEHAKTMELYDDTLEQSRKSLRNFVEGARGGCSIYRDPDEHRAELAGCTIALLEGLAILATRHEAQKK